MKKVICVILVLLILIPVSVFAADDGFTVELFSGAYKAVPLTRSDVMASQFVAVKPFSAVSVYCPSYSNNIGNITIALFEFTENYEKTLSNLPLAEKEYVNFSDSSHIKLTFDDPLPAGEYLVCLYDAYDESGYPGVGVWCYVAHESQRLYRNGSYDATSSFEMYITYTEKPDGKGYGIPTVPALTGEVTPPYKKGSFDFSDDSFDTSRFSDTSDVSFALRNKSLTLNIKPSIDPWIELDYSGLDVSLSKYPVVAMEVKLTGSCPNNNGQLFFTTDSFKSYGEADSVKYNYKQEKDWQKIIIDLSGNGNAGGVLSTLRWDVFHDTETDAQMSVKYVALFSSVAAADAFDGDFSKIEEQTEQESGQVKEKYKVKDFTYGSYNCTEYSFPMDFSNTVEEYEKEKNYGFTSAGNAVIRDGKLGCKALSAFAFYSTQMTGDDYAAFDNTYSFTALIEKGYVNAGLLLNEGGDAETRSGIWFCIEKDKVTVSVADTGQAEIPFDAAKEIKYELEMKRDDKSYLYFKADGKTLLTTTLDYDCGRVSYSVSDGKSEILSGKTEKLTYAGFMKTIVNRLNGYIDDVTYSHTELSYVSANGKPADTSNWVSYDALGRKVTQEKSTKENKYVGLFYFLNHSGDSGSRVTYDATEIYLNEGLDGLKNTLKSIAGRNGVSWAEPYFGYYRSNDVWVFRKHASMLYNAGVDFIFIDVSNSLFYIEQATLLLDTWCEMRAHGQGTPQVCFMYGDMPSTLVEGMYAHLETIYNKEEYKDILFKWNGKVLVLGNDDDPSGADWTVADSVPQTKEEYKAVISADKELYKFAKKEYRSVLSNYTVRKCWAWQSGKYDGYWDWMQYTPQEKGTDKNGNYEQMAVAMGFHPTSSRGRSFVNGEDGYDKGEDFGFSLGTAQYGYAFAEQFEYALSADPQVIMITGWNEWTAGVQVSTQDQVIASTPTPGYRLVDQFTPEYSRDGEPMRLVDGVGFGDNYYYQMVEYIRKFKGSGEPKASPAGSINEETGMPLLTDGDFIFDDTINDTVFRSAMSSTKKFRYTEASGRNDITGASVIQDENSVYISAAAVSDVVFYDKDTFMRLYIDTDRKYDTGWEGYDILVSGYENGKVSVFTLDKDGQRTKTADADYIINGKYVTVKLASSLTGESFDFKWSDNSDALERGVMAFMEKGDAAPDDRFNYRYEFTGYAKTVKTGETTADIPSETITDAETEPQTKEPRQSNAVIIIVTAAVAVAAVVALVFIVIKKRGK